MTQLYYKTSTGYRNLVLDTVYPVGSIYMSIDSTSPSTLFGGTWARITGQFLLAATDNGSSGASQAAGRTGGEATHTLITAEMPSHTHIQNSHTHTQNAHNHAGSTMVMMDKGQWDTNNEGRSTITPTAADLYTPVKISSGWYTGNAQPAIQNTTATNQNTGGNGAHNNMPPYVAVYVWKRTA